MRQKTNPHGSSCLPLLDDLLFCLPHKKASNTACNEQAYTWAGKLGCELPFNPLSLLTPFGDHAPALSYHPLPGRLFKFRRYCG